MADCIAVGLGGFIGAVLRYLITLIKIHDCAFPAKTLFINVLGAFVIGAIASASVKNMQLNPRIVLFLKVGVCGGFTTFSTFALETVSLVQGGKISFAFAYIVLSLALSAVAVLAGGLLFR